MTEQVIATYVSTYGYAILLPLMIIEGPIVTLIGAFLASIGMLNVWVVLVLSIAGDIIGDVVLYGMGYRWGMRFVTTVGKYIGMTHLLIFRLEKFFEQHGGKTIFMVKATTGLCWAAFVTAGVVKMPLWRFVWFSFLGGIAWNSALVVLGYFFGYMYVQIEKYITYAGWVAFGVAILIITIMSVFKKRTTAEVFEEVVK